MTNVTYNQLEEALRSLGFALRAVKEKNKVYNHEGTGALIVIPEPRSTVTSRGVEPRLWCPCQDASWKSVGEPRPPSVSSMPLVSG